MGELTEMPFGLRTRLGPRNRVLDGDPDLSFGRGNFVEGVLTVCTVKYRDILL